MSEIFKNFKNGKLIIVTVGVLIAYGVTGGTYLKSIEDSVVDIKELRTQYNAHEVQVLTQLGVLTEQISSIRRELNQLQRVSFRTKRTRELKTDAIVPRFLERQPR